MDMFTVQLPGSIADPQKVSRGIVVGGLIRCAWNGEGASHGTLVIEQETFVTGIEIDVV